MTEAIQRCMKPVLWILDTRTRFWKKVLSPVNCLLWAIFWRTREYEYCKSRLLPTLAMVYKAIRTGIRTFFRLIFKGISFVKLNFMEIFVVNFLFWSDSFFKWFFYKIKCEFPSLDFLCPFIFKGISFIPIPPEHCQPPAPPHSHLMPCSIRVNNRKKY